MCKYKQTFANGKVITEQDCLEEVRGGFRTIGRPSKEFDSPY